METENLTFRHRMPVQIRFNDVDRFGHVNNNAYFSFYDLGKVDYLSSVLGLYEAGRDVIPVIANINADFLQPIFLGDEIVVETCVSHVGNKSFTLVQQALNVRTDTVVCRCRTVMVCFSVKSQESVEIPDEYREKIRRYESGE